MQRVESKAKAAKPQRQSSIVKPPLAGPQRAAKASDAAKRAEQQAASIGKVKPVRQPTTTAEQADHEEEQSDNNAATQESQCEKQEHPVAAADEPLNDVVELSTSRKKQAAERPPEADGDEFGPTPVGGGNGAFHITETENDTGMQQSPSTNEQVAADRHQEHVGEAEGGAFLTEVDPTPTQASAPPAQLEEKQPQEKHTQPAPPAMARPRRESTRKIVLPARAQPVVSTQKSKAKSKPTAPEKQKETTGADLRPPRVHETEESTPAAAPPQTARDVPPAVEEPEAATMPLSSRSPLAAEEDAAMKHPERPVKPRPVALGYNPVFYKRPTAPREAEPAVAVAPPTRVIEELPPPRKIRLTGDPVVEALEAKMRERREAERKRQQDRETRSEQLRLEFETKQREREEAEIQEKRDKQRAYREAHEKRMAELAEIEQMRQERIAQHLKVDMDVIAGRKTILQKFTEIKSQQHAQEAAEYENAVKRRREEFASTTGADFYQQLAEHDANVQMRQKKQQEERERMQPEKVVVNPLPPEYHTSFRENVLANDRAAQLEVIHKKQTQREIRNNMLEFGSRVQQAVLSGSASKKHGY